MVRLEERDHTYGKKTQTHFYPRSPPSASRLQTLPHAWSMKVWEGIGQVQVVQENHRKVLRLETEQGCISLFKFADGKSSSESCPSPGNGTGSRFLLVGRAASLYTRQS